MDTEAELQASLGCEVLSNVEAYQLVRDPILATPDMRIGVSGAQGTGITTTARMIAQAMNLPLLTEVARTAFEHGFTLGDEGSIKAQCAMWFSQAFLETRRESFVADRTLVDAVAHAELLADLTGDKDDQLVAIAMGNATAQAMQHYTALLFTPIEFELTFDGIRKGDIEFQKRLDDKFRGLFDRLALPYIEVHGTPEERTQQALEVIQAASSGE